MSYPLLPSSMGFNVLEDARHSSVLYVRTLLVETSVEEGMSTTVGRPQQELQGGLQQKHYINRSVTDATLTLNPDC